MDFCPAVCQLSWGERIHINWLHVAGNKTRLKVDLFHAEPRQMKIINDEYI